MKHRIEVHVCIVFFFLSCSKNGVSGWRTICVPDSWFCSAWHHHRCVSINWDIPCLHRRSAEDNFRISAGQSPHAGHPCGCVVVGQFPVSRADDWLPGRDVRVRDDALAVCSHCHIRERPLGHSSGASFPTSQTRHCLWGTLWMFKPFM